MSLGPAWRESLTARAEGIVAADFFHLDAVLGTRCLRITGSHRPSAREGAGQRAWNLAAGPGGRMER